MQAFIHKTGHSPRRIAALRRFSRASLAFCIVFALFASLNGVYEIIYRQSDDSAQVSLGWTALWIRWQIPSRLREPPPFRSGWYIERGTLGLRIWTHPVIHIELPTSTEPGFCVLALWPAFVVIATIGLVCARIRRKLEATLYGVPVAAEPFVVEDATNNVK